VSSWVVMNAIRASLYSTRWQINWQPMQVGEDWNVITQTVPSYDTSNRVLHSLQFPNVCWGCRLQNWVAVVKFTSDCCTSEVQIDLAVSCEIHLRMCRSALRWKWVALVREGVASPLLSLPLHLSTCWLMKDRVSSITPRLYAVWSLNGDGSNVNCSDWPFNRCRK